MDHKNVNMKTPHIFSPLFTQQIYLEQLFAVVVKKSIRSSPEPRFDSGNIEVRVLLFPSSLPYFPHLPNNNKINLFTLTNSQGVIRPFVCTADVPRPSRSIDPTFQHRFATSYLAQLSHT